MPDEDTGLEFSGDVHFIPPDLLCAVEAYFGGSWAPVTTGEGLRITVPNKEAGEALIIQIRQRCIAKGKRIPPFRVRPLTIEESRSAIQQHIRARQKGDFGTDILNTKPPHDLPK